MYEYYTEENLFNHEYRFNPEAWTIANAIPIKPVTVNFPAQASANTVGIDTTEQSWIDNIMSAYNDSAGYWAYNTTRVGPCHPFTCNADEIRVMVPSSQEEKEEDLVEDVDLSMFI